MDTYIISFQTKKMDEPQYVISVEFEGAEVTSIETKEGRDNAVCFDIEQDALDIAMFMGASAKVEKVEFEYKRKLR